MPDYDEFHQNSIDIKVGKQLYDGDVVLIKYTIKIDDQTDVGFSYEDKVNIDVYRNGDKLITEDTNTPLNINSILTQNHVDGDDSNIQNPNSPVRTTSSQYSNGSTSPPSSTQNSQQNSQPSSPQNSQKTSQQNSQPSSPVKRQQTGNDFNLFLRILTNTDDDTATDNTVDNNVSVIQGFSQNHDNNDDENYIQNAIKIVTQRNNNLKNNIAALQNLAKNLNDNKTLQNDVNGMIENLKQLTNLIDAPDFQQKFSQIDPQQKSELESSTTTILQRVGTFANPSRQTSTVVIDDNNTFATSKHAKITDTQKDTKSVSVMAPENLAFAPITNDFSERKPVSFDEMNTNYKKLLVSNEIIDNENKANLERKTGGGDGLGHPKGWGHNYPSSSRPTPRREQQNSQVINSKSNTVTYEVKNLTPTDNFECTVRLASTLFYISKKIMRIPVALLILATKDNYKHNTTTSDIKQENLADELRLEYLHSIFLDDHAVIDMESEPQLNQSFFAEEFSKNLKEMFDIYKTKLVGLEPKTFKRNQPNNNKHIRLDQLCYYLLTFAKRMRDSGAKITATDYVATLTLINELCQRIELITNYWFKQFKFSNGELYHSRISFLNSVLAAKLKKYMNAENSIVTYVKMRIDGYAAADRNPRFGRLIPSSESELSSDSQTLSIEYSDDSRGMVYSPNNSNDPNNPPIGTKVLKYKTTPPEKFTYNNNFKFGPYSYIFTSDMTNSKIANSVAFRTDIIDKITSGKPTCIIGYGSSGSGKTSTLIKLIVKNKDGEVTYQEDGIFMEITKIMSGKNYTKANVAISEFKSFEQDPTTTEQKFNLNDSGLAELILDHLNNSEKRAIWATPNNPVSSRSHVILVIKYYKDDNDINPAILIICDFAGVENKFNCDNPVVLDQFKQIKEYTNSDRGNIDDVVAEKLKKFKENNVQEKKGKQQVLINSINQAIDSQTNLLTSDTGIGDNIIQHIDIEDIEESKYDYDYDSASKNPNVEIDGFKYMSVLKFFNCKFNNSNISLNGTPINEYLNGVKLLTDTIKYLRYFKGWCEKYGNSKGSTKDTGTIKDYINNTLTGKTFNLKMLLINACGGNSDFSQEKILFNNIINFFTNGKIERNELIRTTGIFFYEESYDIKSCIFDNLIMLAYHTDFIEKLEKSTTMFQYAILYALNKKNKLNPEKETQEDRDLYNKAQVDFYQKSTAEICKERTKEGMFINQSLKQLREFIGYELTHMNGPDYPNFVGECAKIQCNPYFLECFGKKDFLDVKEYENTENLPKSTLGEFITKSVGDKQVTYCIFCVINLSKKANNPPPIPYINITDLQSEYQRLKNSLYESFDPSDKKTDPTTLSDPAKDALIALRTNPLYLSLDTSTKEEVFKNMQLLFDSNTRINERLPYLKNILQIINNSNAATTIGTLEYTETMAKYGFNEVTCSTEGKYIERKDRNDVTVYEGNGAYEQSAPAPAPARSSARSSAPAPAPARSSAPVSAPPAYDPAPDPVSKSATVSKNTKSSGTVKNTNPDEYRYGDKVKYINVNGKEVDGTFVKIKNLKDYTIKTFNNIDISVPKEKVKKIKKTKGGNKTLRRRRK